MSDESTQSGAGDAGSRGFGLKVAMALVIIAAAFAFIRGQARLDQPAPGSAAATPAGSPTKVSNVRPAAPPHDPVVTASGDDLPSSSSVLGWRQQQLGEKPAPAPVAVMPASPAGGTTKVPAVIRSGADKPAGGPTARWELAASGEVPKPAPPPAVVEKKTLLLPPEAPPAAIPEAEARAGTATSGETSAAAAPATVSEAASTPRVGAPESAAPAAAARSAPPVRSAQPVVPEQRPARSAPPGYAQDPALQAIMAEVEAMRRGAEADRRALREAMEQQRRMIESMMPPPPPPPHARGYYPPGYPYGGDYPYR